MDNTERVKRYKRIRTQLIEIRKPWDTLAETVVLDLLPGYEQYVKPGQNGGQIKAGRYSRVVDNTGPQALKLATAGLQSGLTSPARPWFSYGSFDPQKSSWGPFRQWYQMLEKTTFRTLAFTNFYDVARRVYEGELGFGTTCIIVEPDWQKVVRYIPLCFGEFWLIVDDGGTPLALYRDLWLSAEQAIRQFGKNAVSQKIRNAYENHNQKPFQVHHVIEKNLERDPAMLDNRNMPWSSVYFEAAPDRDGDLLRDSGYLNRPFIAPRWDAAGRNPYGEAQSFFVLGQLGLLREMNLGQIRGMHYQVDPPVVAPESWKKKQLNRLPGGVSYVDTDKTHQYGPLFSVNPDISGVTLGIQDRREMIRDGFFNDLLFAISKNHIETATEALQLYEEQILMLSPAIERQFFEFLDPALDITVEIMAARGLVPPAPDDIQGEAINVEYTSRLAQAQRAAWTTPIEQTMLYFEKLMAINPESIDLFDFDASGREYADLIGCPVHLVRDQDAVMQIRQQRAQAHAMEARRQAGLQNIAAMKGLADIPVGQGNALDQIEQQGAQA